MYNARAMKKKKDKIINEFDTADSENSLAAEIELEDVEELEEHKIKVLREKLKACEKEKSEHMETLQRTKADFLNSKRRLDEQFQRDTERIALQYIEKLLPLCDSFNMAMADENAWNATDEKWRTGIEAIYAQLQTILAQSDVTEIREIGVAFDPHLHEAVSNELVDNVKKVDTIISILQRGYRQGDIVIRPARVTVGACGT
jgi:molecular chaperone GrpE